MISRRLIPEVILIQMYQFQIEETTITTRSILREDFGDGGAFPEINYAHYPLDMVRKTDSHDGQKTVPMIVDDKGNLSFDAIVSHSGKIVNSHHRDINPKVLKDD